MSGTLAVVLFILAIIVVILIHEAAHFAVARLFKIKVEEFFVGFGPRLWSVKRGETEYGVKALPLGGYVRIAGMNPFQEPTPEEYPRTFGAKPIWQRALVIFAGPATHFVIAFLIAVAFFGLIGAPSKVAPEIGAVQRTLAGEPSPAFVAGLRPGDEIVRIDDISRPTPEQVIDSTKQHLGQPLTLVVRRDGRTISVTVTPVFDRKLEKARIGVVVEAGRILARDRLGPVQAVARGGGAVGQTTWAVITRLGDVFGPHGIGRIFDLLFGNAERTSADVTSGVGLGRVAYQAGSQGQWDILMLILLGVNVFVGILNLIPLPPFDGGHLAVLAIEKVRGRKVDMRRLVPITAVVAAFLVLFMISVLYLDIVKPIPNVLR